MVAVVLLAWSLATSGGGREADTDAPTASASDLARLRADLAREGLARRELEGELAALRVQLAAGGWIPAEGPATAFPGQDGRATAQPVPGQAPNPLAGGHGGAGPFVASVPATKESASNSVFSLEAGAPGAFGSRVPQSAAASPEPAPETPRPDPSGEEPGFDTDALVAQVGLHPDEATELREHWEQFSLDRLALADQANREGWRYRPRFRREARRLESEMLGELGEERFDQLLYASGRSNRVVVRDVLEYSTAEYAGLQPGDIITRYDDRAIFDTRQLQSATAGGELGEPVRLELLRGGERVIVDVERGPLGTLLRSSREPPDLD